MTCHEQLRQSRSDFVIDSFQQADVVLVVVSEDLRASWQTARHYNSTVTLSVAQLLLQRLRDEVIHRPTTTNVLSARYRLHCHIGSIQTAMQDIDACVRQAGYGALQSGVTQ